MYTKIQEEFSILITITNSAEDEYITSISSIQNMGVLKDEIKKLHEKYKLLTTQTKKLEFDLEMEEGHVNILRHDNQSLKKSAVNMVCTLCHVYHGLLTLVTDCSYRTRRGIHFQQVTQTYHRTKKGKRRTNDPGGTRRRISNKHVAKKVDTGIPIWNLLQYLFINNPSSSRRKKSIWRMLWNKNKNTW